MRHELSDNEWTAIGPMLPPQDGQFTRKETQSVSAQST